MWRSGISHKGLGCPCRMSHSIVFPATVFTFVIILFKIITLCFSILFETLNVSQVIRSLTCITSLAFECGVYVAQRRSHVCVYIRFVLLLCQMGFPWQATVCVCLRLADVSFYWCNNSIHLIPGPKIP